MGYSACLVRVSQSSSMGGGHGAQGLDLWIYFFTDPESMNDKATNMLLDKLIRNIQRFMITLQLL